MARFLLRLFRRKPRRGTVTFTLSGNAQAIQDSLRRISADLERLGRK